MIINEEDIRRIAANEGITEEELKKEVGNGTAVIMGNPRHAGLISCAVGRKTSTKVNLNLGLSPGFSCIAEEKEKLAAALDLGADTVMDLSVGEHMDEARQAILTSCACPVGTVPVYQAADEAMRSGRAGGFSPDCLFDAIARHGAGGVDFVTVHAGLTRRALAMVRRDRVLGVVSRGGAIMGAWMEENDCENPLYTGYDRLLELARYYDLTLSLGDGLRPGCIADGSDRGQFEELMTLGELTRRALEAGVRVIVEGPGHLNLNQIEMNMRLQKQLCHGVPFYILGPLVTDIAPGYDHITAAIGSALAAAAGADYICCVSPAEHLGLPDIQDIQDAVVAGKIAAHAADLAKGIPRAAGQDLRMAAARRQFAWDAQFAAAIHPERARAKHRASSDGGPGCSMCGHLCAMRIYQEGMKNCET